MVFADKSSARVMSTQGNGCSACNGKGCGSGKLTQLFCSKPREFSVENRISASVGDEVIVSVEEGAVLHGIALVYALPLLLMFAGATLLSRFSSNAASHDGYAALGSLLGLSVGFFIAREILNRARRKKPYIARLFLE